MNFFMLIQFGSSFKYSFTSITLIYGSFLDIFISHINDRMKLLFMFFELGFPGERLAAYVARKYCTSVVGLFVPLS